MVVGPADDRRVAELRARGIAAVARTERSAALAWARAWGFTHVLDSTGWVDAASGASIPSPLEQGRKRREMTAVVVVGAQWGDEGKGKIVDIFTEHADMVVRYGGGPNAGHTLVVGDEQASSSA